MNIAVATVYAPMLTSVTGDGTDDPESLDY